MTVQQQNFLKNNWINFSTLVVVIGFIVSQAKWQQKVDTHFLEFDKHTKEFRAHEKSESLHMPYSIKVKEFVQRTEYEKDILEIKEMIKEQNITQKEQNKLLIEILRNSKK
jgi:hypothetical protein